MPDTLPAGVNSDSLMRDVLDELVEKKVRKSHTNVLDSLSNRGYPETFADLIIAKAIENQAIEKYNYTRQTHYKLTDSDDVVIQDPADPEVDEVIDEVSEEVSDGVSDNNIPINKLVQPKYILLEDFINYKTDVDAKVNSMADEIANLRGEIIQLVNNPIPQHHFTTTNPQIDFLQNTITLLIKKLPENQPASPPCSIPTHAPNPTIQNKIVHKSPALQSSASHSSASTSSAHQSSAPKSSAPKPSAPKPSASLSSAPQSSATKSSAPANDTTRRVRNTSDDFEDELTRKNVQIIGDSMLHNIDAKRMRKQHDTSILPLSGATSRDMIDYVRPRVLSQKPDVLILHVGSNDLDHPEINTVESMTTVFKLVKEISPSTKLVWSNCFHRYNTKPDEGPRSYVPLVNDLNRKMSALCKRMDVQEIDNSNITKELLGAGLWHPGDGGKRVFASNLIRFIRKC